MNHYIYSVYGILTLLGGILGCGAGVLTHMLILNCTLIDNGLVKDTIGVTIAMISGIVTGGLIGILTGIFTHYLSKKHD
jgi:hypothetical protein